MTRSKPLAANKFKAFVSAAILSTAFGALLTMGSPGPALAVETMLVHVDQAQILRLDEPADSIIIGNPMIADAAIHDSQMLVITGISYGSTNMIILNAEGREIFSGQLEVRLSARSQVTVQRGGNRYSYACAPNCEPVLAIGDNKEQFDNVREAIAGRIESATGGTNQRQ